MSATPPTTVMPQAERLRDEFGVEAFVIVIVGDRAMMSKDTIGHLREMRGVDCGVWACVDGASFADLEILRAR